MASAGRFESFLVIAAGHQMITTAFDLNAKPPSRIARSDSRNIADVTLVYRLVQIVVMEKLPKPRGKRIRGKIGDVFEIPLPNGKFAYGRVYDDARVGIYNMVSESPDSPPLGCRDLMFNVGMYEDILKSGEWKIIAHDPFENGEPTFPPPSYIFDEISGEYSIYHQGEIRPASEAECAGLERTAVWDSHHIIEPILNT